jgi:hypothetical protein
MLLIVRAILLGCMSPFVALCFHAGHCLDWSGSWGRAANVCAGCTDLQQWKVDRKRFSAPTLMLARGMSQASR